MKITKDELLNDKQELASEKEQLYMDQKKLKQATDDKLKIRVFSKLFTR